MYRQEILKKLNVTDSVFPFTLTLLSRDKLVVSGVKRVLFADGNRLKFQLHGGILNVEGAGLAIVEIGGGDAYVKGDIGGLDFED